jgi:hypothetical protein
LLEGETETEVKETLKSLGLKFSEITKTKSQRSIDQNSALHKWFELLEQECIAGGMTMDMLIKKPQEIPITRHLLKDMFRLIGNVMYHKDSTAKLTKDEINEVIKVFEKTIGERLEIFIPFPSVENLILEENNLNL